MISNTSHNIAPALVIRGKNAWLKGHQISLDLCSKPLLIGRSFSTFELRLKILNDLREKGLDVSHEEKL